jgi:hypothetical protein
MLPPSSGTFCISGNILPFASLAISSHLPSADILQHCDYVDAVFQRSPKLAIAFAYVFGQYLLIPVGQVSGSLSALSYFSLLLDIQAYVATCADLITGYPMHPLAAAGELPPEPAPSSLAPAVADSLNPALTALEASSHSNCCFVDNNGVAGLRSTIQQSLHNSVVSAFLLFGWPDEDCRSSCLTPDKWEKHILFDMLYLGFWICSRTMQVTWPRYKRTELHNKFEWRSPFNAPALHLEASPPWWKIALG